jgi:hypothetical protein
MSVSKFDLVICLPPKIILTASESVQPSGEVTYIVSYQQRFHGSFVLLNQTALYFVASPTLRGRSIDLICYNEVLTASSDCFKLLKLPKCGIIFLNSYFGCSHLYSVYSQHFDVDQEQL